MAGLTKMCLLQSVWTGGAHHLPGTEHPFSQEDAERFLRLKVAQVIEGAAEGKPAELPSPADSLPLVESLVLGPIPEPLPSPAEEAPAQAPQAPSEPLNTPSPTVTPEKKKTKP